MSQKLYAEVIVDIAHEKVDRIFHYSIPETFQFLIQIGMRVLVPFGRSNKKMEGYVLGFTSQSNVETKKIKNILQVIDDVPILNSEMIELVKWMKEQYQCTLIECIHCILPSGIQVKSQWVIVLPKNISLFKSEILQLPTKAQLVLKYIYEQGNEVPLKDLENIFGPSINNIIYTLRKKKLLFQKSIPKVKNLKKKIKVASLISLKIARKAYQECKEKKYFAQARILDFLIQNNQAPLSEIKQVLQVSDSSFRSLEKKGVIMIEEVEVKRVPYLGGPKIEEQNFIPTQEQQNVIQYIEKELDRDKSKTILLHGVTGSGKTEVYLQIIDKLLQQGKQAIVLVPEISLTPQITQRFIQRFGEQVAFTHSKLSIGERYDQWRRAKEGEVSIMVGPRSAVFTPFSSLGLIIIDEEHETTYKSETTPKYHAREIAQKRCEINHGIVLLGSATPTMESYFLAKKGCYQLLTMKKRATIHSLPDVHIVDMREELMEGNRSMFSKDLYKNIKTNLENKEQTILFLNRRGHSTFISCRNCGFVAKCSKCNIAYTYHTSGSLLKCHYCGEQKKSPRICPQCGSSYIRFFGTGTQKVEEETKKLFPKARILRMDLDTTAGKYGHTKILSQFYRGEGDILIGTQMIAKGHDFPNVTLVGIMAADLSLYMSSYHAAEINYQLITQAAGRAGRDEYEGKVFIQTYHPEHYSIVLAAQQNYKQFYEQECKYRQFMEYPPFSHLFAILLSGTDEKQVMDSTFELVDMMKKRINHTTIELLGPSPATISKIKKEYRWRIILKGKDEQELKKFVLSCVQLFQDKRRRVYLNLIYNPLGIV